MPVPQPICPWWPVGWIPEHSSAETSWGLLGYGQIRSVPRSSYSRVSRTNRYEIRISKRGVAKKIKTSILMAKQKSKKKWKFSFQKSTLESFLRYWRWSLHSFNPIPCGRLKLRSVCHLPENGISSAPPPHVRSRLVKKWDAGEG